METNVIILVTRRYLVSIGDKEAMVSGGKMMVARMNENKKPARRSGDVCARYCLAVAPDFIALTACGWVDPATDRLVGLAPGEETQ